MDLLQFRWSSDDEKRGATITTTRLKEEGKKISHRNRASYIAPLYSRRPIPFFRKITVHTSLEFRIHRTFGNRNPSINNYKPWKLCFLSWIPTLLLPMLGEPLPEVCLWSGLWKVLFLNLLFCFCLGDNTGRGISGGRQHGNDSQLLPRLEQTILSLPFSFV